MRRKTSRGVLLLGLLLPMGLQAQEPGRVTGLIVSSDTRQPLAGAQVTVQGTTLGTLSAPSGRYSITSVPAGRRTVEVTLLGYAKAQLTVTVPAAGLATANFVLQSEAVAMKELVVVGYGTQKKQQVTGSVASVTADQFEQGPERDAVSLIAGKVAGLAVVTPRGDPTSTAQVVLRGITTINASSSPLVLVDGIPGNLNTVAPEDIDAISVLKDGSAAAIYGTRASNGVILITTKKYQGGRPTLRYDGYIGESTLYRTPDFLTAADYRAKIAAGYKTSDGVGFTDLGFGTDWIRAVLRQPMSYMNNLTLTGGAPNTNYTLGANIQSEQGIFQRSDNHELTIHADIRHEMFDGKLGFEGNLVNRNQWNFAGPNFDYAWRQALIRNPTDRITADDGTWQQRSGYFYTNPLSLIDEQNGQDNSTTTRLHGTVTYRPFTQLRFSLMGGAEKYSDLYGTAETFQHPDNTQSNNGGYAYQSAASSLNRIMEATGTYAQTFGDHDVTLLGGYSYNDFVNNGFNASNTRFPTDLFGYDNLSSGAGLLAGAPSTGIGSYKNGYKLIGFFSRLNYDFRNRYLLMASARYEGNSRFGADHKWGLFPALSLGWRLSEEGFFKRALPFFSDFRLRAGYGVTGIAPGSSYLSLTSYSYGSYFLYNGNWIRQLAPARNPNPDLRWEQKEELNGGVNFAALDSRLTGSIDVYRRDTKDMLYSYSVPVPPNLTSSILANVGTMRNKGVEVELGYDVIRRNNFSWNTNANWSTNRNLLVTLSNSTYQPSSDCRFDGYTGEPIQTSTHKNCVGQPIGNFWGFKSIGIDSTGAWIVQDSSGNPISIRKASEKDKHYLGNGFPKQFFAWNNTARFHNVDVSLNLRGAAGFQILNFMRMFYENPKIIQYNMLRSAFDKAYGTRTVNYDLALVSYYIENGDYLKVDNATIGYTINPRLLGPAGRALTGARIYVSGRNLYTFTGYKGMDPEVPTTGGAMMYPGDDQRDSYPTVRRFTFGVTASF